MGVASPVGRIYYRIEFVVEDAENSPWYSAEGCEAAETYAETGSIALILDFASEDKDAVVGPAADNGVGELQHGSAGG